MMMGGWLDGESSFGPICICKQVACQLSKTSHIKLLSVAEAYSTALVALLTQHTAADADAEHVTAAVPLPCSGCC